MTKLKGVKRINNILNEFLAQFELTAEIDSDFAYYDRCNLITYSLIVPSVMDKWFKEFAKIIDSRLSCDIFLLSLCHEIGHNMTVDEFDDSDWAVIDDDKELINTAYNEAAQEGKEDLQKVLAFAYFDLPDERAATSWAVNYIMTHQQEIVDLWQKLQPAIMDFYRENEVI